MPRLGRLSSHTFAVDRLTIVLRVVSAKYESFHQEGQRFDCQSVRSRFHFDSSRLLNITVITWTVHYMPELRTYDVMTVWERLSANVANFGVDFAARLASGLSH